MMKKIKEFFKGKEKIGYPKEFIFIEYSLPAKRDGLKGDINKIVHHYFINERGFREIKKYRYSQSLINSFKKIKQIPILDKTRVEDELFPVSTSINLSNISYKK